MREDPSRERHRPRARPVRLSAPTVVPPGMKVVKIDATVDSGAEAVVAPPEVIPGEVQESAMSREGRQYQAANGSKIANFGQTEAEFRTEEG